MPGAIYSANLTIASNDPTQLNASVPLSATAVAHSVPALQWKVASTTLTFPDLVIAGQAAAAPLVARLANPDGPGAVDLQALRLVGADASSFTLSACPALLYQGESCDVSIGFTPGSGGAKTAQLQVLTTTGVAPPLLTLQGQGAGNSSAYLVVSATALDFGGVRVGASSAPVELRVAASGDGPMRITGISAEGPFSVASKSCPAVPFTLAPGAECSLNVTFMPTASSAMSGVLRIATDSGARATEVTLGGGGQDAASVSGGGCSLAEGDTLDDPTLWLLAVAALAALGYRGWLRRSARRLRGGPPA
jgi:hypothetical protein